MMLMFHCKSHLLSFYLLLLQLKGEFNQYVVTDFRKSVLLSFSGIIGIHASIFTNHFIVVSGSGLNPGNAGHEEGIHAGWDEFHPVLFPNSVVTQSDLLPGIL